MNGIGKMERKKRAYMILLLIPSIVLPMIFTYYPMIKGSIMTFQIYNLMDIGKHLSMKMYDYGFFFSTNKI